MWVLFWFGAHFRHIDFDLNFPKSFDQHFWKCMSCLKYLPLHVGNPRCIFTCLNHSERRIGSHMIFVHFEEHKSYSAERHPEWYLRRSTLPLIANVETRPPKKQRISFGSQKLSTTHVTIIQRYSTVCTDVLVHRVLKPHNTTWISFYCYFIRKHWM